MRSPTRFVRKPTLHPLGLTKVDFVAAASFALGILGVYDTAYFAIYGHSAEVERLGLTLTSGGIGFFVNVFGERFKPVDVPSLVLHCDVLAFGLALAVGLWARDN